MAECLAEFELGTLNTIRRKSRVRAVRVEVIGPKTRTASKNRCQLMKETLSLLLQTFVFFKISDEIADSRTELSDAKLAKKKVNTRHK